MTTTLLTLSTLAFIGGVGTPELIVLALLGLLIFGKRLPEVGKSLGRGIVEFKRGLSGIDDDLEQAARQPPRIEKRESGSLPHDASRASEPTTESDKHPGQSA